MKKEQQEGIFVVAENTHHYNGAPSGTLYTFMKGRGLWIKDPLDIAFFQGKVERGSGFHIEKSAINIADKVKVVKKEEKAATASMAEKIKKKLPGKKKPTTDKKAAATKAESKEKLKKALEVLEELDKKEAKAKAAEAKEEEPEVAVAESEEVEK